MTDDQSDAIKQVLIDEDELSKLQAVAEAASDYLRATHDSQFGNVNGGVGKLQEILFAHTQAWESYSLANASERT